MNNSWLIIGTITFLITTGASFLKPKDVEWYQRLRRPRWLVFEGLIPVIWTVIFICGAWSANLIWEINPGSFPSWLLMAFYLLLEIIIVIYPPTALWSHNLQLATFVGGLGCVLGAILTFIVWGISGSAALLLIPYLLWSPIGTYITWEIGRLNPEYA